MGIATNQHTALWQPAWSQGVYDQPERRVGDMWVIAAVNQATQVVAHNYDFERAIWENIMVKRYGFPEIPTEKWDCTMARGAARCYPMSLEHMALATEVSQEKDTVGGRLVQRLCKPLKGGEYDEDPEKYKRLYSYCLQDVEVTKALDEALPALTGDERRTFLLDAEINRRGVSVDRESVAKIVGILDKEVERGNEELSKITDGEITSHGQSEKIAEYAGIADCQKSTVARELEGDRLAPRQRRVLEIRRQLSKTSTKKFPAMLERCCADERIRGILQYHGASTGRWAGRGIQPQNLPRWPKGINGEEVLSLLTTEPDMCELVYGNLHEAASWTLRSCLQAGPGKTLFCGDFSSIEGRVLAWYAGEAEILQAYRDGLDMYKVAASLIYDKPYKEIMEDERFVGKVSELSLGYQGWVKAFMGMLEGFGVDNFSEYMAKSVCSGWREKRKRTVELWGNTAEDAIEGAGMFSKDGKDLICTLPSGRHIVYADAQVRTVEDPYGRKKPTLTFMTARTPSMRKQQILAVHPNTPNYVRIKTYGGCLVENIVQATARDLLVEAMMRGSTEFPITFHVHDEFVAEAEETKELDEFLRLFSIVPDWGEGIPINVTGWKGKRYRK